MDAIINFTADFGAWLQGAVVVVGLVQWLKGLFAKAPSWVWAITAPAIAIGYAFAPEAIRNAAGFLAVSQLSYETIMQRFFGNRKEG